VTCVSFGIAGGDQLKSREARIQKRMNMRDAIVTIEERRKHNAQSLEKFTFFCSAAWPESGPYEQRC
jgi:hypothetical protein